MVQEREIIHGRLSARYLPKSCHHQLIYTVRRAGVGNIIAPEAQRHSKMRNPIRDASDLLLKDGFNQTFGQMRARRLRRQRCSQACIYQRTDG
eukprot:7514061-Pyramimonas_sp.AAC.1